MNRKKQLESIVKKAREELWDIEKAEAIQKNTPLIGKFFKVRNCYSCPKKDEYWWLYTTITGIDDGGSLKGWRFQKDIYGKVEIEPNSGLYITDHIEITEGEFRKEWANLLSILKRLW
jgi:hypothetical protein